jgi:hypothetical protein
MVLGILTLLVTVLGSTSIPGELALNELSFYVIIHEGYEIGYTPYDYDTCGQWIGYYILHSLGDRLINFMYNIDVIITHQNSVHPPRDPQVCYVSIVANNLLATVVIAI